jgi:flagellar hook-basal body complex protein FliE
MATEPVSFIPALREVSAESIARPDAGKAAGGDFGAWLSQSLGRVNQDLVRADEGLQQLATGEAQNLHQVMISLEEARIGMQLLVQVRNRLLESYQEILRMQV